MAKQIAFMVMPFSTKKTGLGPEQGPTEVDFDALWEKALSPALSELGYHPVRADQDVGALIIVEMIQRLAYSDLVVADISIANANVYYEIGVRHAAKQHGCVLTSADWGRALFDIDQMPRLVYALPDGSVPDDVAAGIKETLKGAIPTLSAGSSPVYQAVPDFQEGITDEMRAESFAADVEALNTVMSRIHSVHVERDKAKKAEKALALSAALEEEGNLQDGVRLAIMQMLRDCADWDAMIAYIGTMPDLLRDRAVVKEQLALAHGKSKSGDPLEAVGALDTLIKESGPTAERWGLIGGRYKTMYDGALENGDEAAAAGYLSDAIRAYEQGMMCDLNEYYPTCNLPRLLRIRGEEGDVEHARALSVVVMKACDRAALLDPDDEWIPLTRLGLAFDAEDADEAERLARGILRDYEAVWKKNTTIEDLRKSVSLVQDPVRKRGLQKVLVQLEAILPEEERVTTVDRIGDGAAAPATSAGEAAPSEREGDAPPTPSSEAAERGGGGATTISVGGGSGPAETVRIDGKGVVVTIRIEAG